MIEQLFVAVAEPVDAAVEPGDAAAAAAETAAVVAAVAAAIASAVDDETVSVAAIVNAIARSGLLSFRY